MIFRFYKEEDGKWFVDLPNWKGNKDALEMIDGADTLLDIVSGYNKEIRLNVSLADDTMPNKLIKKQSMEGVGGYYRWSNRKGEITDNSVYLCPVMEFVFGGYPSTIYFNKTC